MELRTNAGDEQFTTEQAKDQQRPDISTQLTAINCGWIESSGQILLWQHPGKVKIRGLAPTWWLKRTCDLRSMLVQDDQASASLCICCSSLYPTLIDASAKLNSTSCHGMGINWVIHIQQNNTQKNVESGDWVFSWNEKHVETQSAIEAWKHIKLWYI